VSDDGGRGLVDALVRDLAPVRPLPRLRVVATGALLLWALGALAVLAAFGSRPGTAVLGAGAGASAVALGLGVSGFAAVIAALARSVPGRERDAGVAGVAAGVGLLVALGAAVLLAVAAPVAAEPAPRSADLWCLGGALLAALLPGALVAWFCGRALAHGPLAVALAAATGAAALGALGMLSGCPFLDPRHLLTGHAAAPALGAVLLTVPVLLALRALRPR
jgi:hypothetical protein